MQTRHERDLAQANAANPQVHEPAWVVDRDEAYALAMEAHAEAWAETHCEYCDCSFEDGPDGYCDCSCHDEYDGEEDD